MTPDRKAFIEYSAAELRTVETANGAVLLGIGLGKVRLLVSVEGHTRSIVLTDVLHVPQIRGNLISIARLQDKGIVVETTVPPARKALIIKHQGRIVGIASRIGDTFVLDMPIDRAFPVRQITDHNGRELDATRAKYTR